MLVDGLDYLGVDQEMVHLMDGASLLFVLVVVRVLVIDIAVFLATFLHETDAVHVVMVKHDCR